MASSASDKRNAFVMYFSTCKGCLPPSAPVSFIANNSKALSIGPHRLPTTVISSITKGAALNFSPAAQLLLRIRVPIGRHRPAASVNPAGLPVASTTTSYFPAWAEATPLKEDLSIHSDTNLQSTPLALTNLSFCSCFPKSTGTGCLSLSETRAKCSRPNTSAIMRPSLPSPRMATRSGRPPSYCMRPCSGIRHAAASGSANTATSSEMWSSTTCRFDSGNVKYSAMAPLRFKIPKTDRLGQ
mmetsp:Transcript_32643/g.59098  ORF Transcript_32643/g.59098 Transcript_32643/m.59098 type:complete len:242 (-) Transcript_32643:446-1171(-)